MARVGAASLALFAAALLAGCGSKPPLASETHVLEAGGAAELNLFMNEGDSIRWDWEADRPLEFNVHTHHGSDVSHLALKQGLSGSSRFMAPADDLYSLMWVNEGPSPARLEYVLRGSAVLV